jgi:hypothetical protein
MALSNYAAQRLSELSALTAAEPLAAAAMRLAHLPAGTRLGVAINGSELTLTAPGMAPIALCLFGEGAELVVDGQLAEQMAEVAEAVTAAHAESDPLPTDVWFWIAASLLAAGNGGVK